MLQSGNWRDKPPTQKQMEYIREIQEFSDYSPPAFNGSTRGEAADYISKHGKLAHENVNSPVYGY